jgi:hypothetical protein
MSKSLGQLVEPGLLLVARSIFAHGVYSGVPCQEALSGRCKQPALMTVCYSSPA